jgi:oligopeptidase B
VWANDNQTLLYIEKDPETLLGLKVRKHVLGTDPRGDAIIFEQTDKTLYTGVSKSKSDRFIFIHMDGTLTSEWRYAEADDPTLTFKVFSPRQRDHEYEIEHVGDHFVIRTNWQARNFRVMWVPIGREGHRSEWRDLAAHREDTYIEDFDVFASHLALSVRTGGLRRLGFQALAEGADTHFIASDEPAYTTSMGANSEIDSELLRYTYASLATPATAQRHCCNTRRDPTACPRTPVLPPPVSA